MLEGTLILIIIGVSFSACGVGSSRQSGIAGDIDSYEEILGVPGYSFYRPVSMAVDSPFVFIADSRDDNIAVFDWDLRYLYNIGRKGQGPGELARVTDITVQDGILAALSLSSGRISIFNYKGDDQGEIPITVTQWGDITFSSNNTVLLVHFDRVSDRFVIEYSREGEVLTEQFPKPDVTGSVSQAKARIRAKDDQIFLVFQHEPRIAGYGSHTFDWEYDLVPAYPFLRRYYRARRALERKGTPGAHIFAMQGGFDILDDLLIIAGPIYHLMVLDTSSGFLRTIDLGSLAEKLVESGHATFSDVKIVGEELLLLSEMSSCVVKLKVADVLAAAETGTVLAPLPQ